jgi:hypothetical protein
MTNDALASTVLILAWLIVIRLTRYSKWQVALISAWQKTPYLRGR